MEEILRRIITGIRRPINAEPITKEALKAFLYAEGEREGIALKKALRRSRGE